MDVRTALNIKGPLTVSTADNSTYELQVTSSTLTTNKSIVQTASQGSENDNLIKVSTYAPVSGSSDPSNSTSIDVPGQIYINTTSNVVFVYTGEIGGDKQFVSLGNPAYENTIENVIINNNTHLTPGNISVSGTTYAKAINIISPSSYGTSGQFLTSAGSSASPSWTNLYTPVKVNSTSASGILSTSDTEISIYAPTSAASGASRIILSDSSGLPVWSSGSKGGALRTMYLDGTGQLAQGDQLYDENITLNGSTSNHNIISKNTNFALSFYAPTTNSNNDTGTNVGGEIVRWPSSGSTPIWDTVDTTATYNSTHLITSGAVYSAIANLPTPMQFKGTVGNSGATISYSDLSNSTYRTEGATYKAISDGTIPSGYAADSNDRNVETGDTLVCNDQTYWVRIPSGDEEDGTVTQVSVGDGLTTTDIPSGNEGDPITTTGTISIADGFKMWHYTATNVGSSIYSNYTASVDLSSDMPLGMRPRIVQVFDSNNEQILADIALGSDYVNIEFTNVGSNTNSVNIICW